MQYNGVCGCAQNWIEIKYIGGAGNQSKLENTSRAEALGVTTCALLPNDQFQRCVGFYCEEFHVLEENSRNPAQFLKNSSRVQYHV